ncbi:MAG: sigma-70 family RNA polymerase sigma factor [Kofleriaceae bacterium]
MEHATVTSEQLLAEIHWIRGLARALVRDASTADDVAQETWLVATEQQPAIDRPLRPWLGRVVVNLVRTRRRGDTRRAERDTAFDAQRSVPTPAELVERVELQRVLSDEVLALAEPYRSTILLHFYEGLSSAEIARRLGIPDGTVRRRLKVALDELRRALHERTDSPARGWVVALGSFTGSPASTPAAATLGAIAMKKLIAVAVVILLLLVIGGAVWRSRHSADQRSADGTSVTGSGGLHATQSSTLAVANALPRWVTASAAAPRRIAGRVVFRGTPVAGARVVLGIEVASEPDTPLVLPESAPKLLTPLAAVTSAPDGSFDFGERARAVFVVSASTSERAAASISVANVDPRVRTDQLVVALGACATRLSGVIADASGGPIANARISSGGLLGSESNASGEYSLCVTSRRAIGPTTAQIRVEADGYGSIKRDVIVAGDLRLDIQLVPEAVLVGRVTTSSGTPVADARVVAIADPTNLQLASGWDTSDREGRFRIRALAPGAFDVAAQGPGFMMATPVAAVAQPASTSRELKLVVSQTARVRGHVMMNDAPVVDAQVVAVHTGHPIGTATTQGDGSFTLETPYGTATLAVMAHRIESSTAVHIDRPVVDGIRVDVAPLARIHGRVTRGGKPVPETDVMYVAPPQALIIGGPTTARTDANGDFTIAGLPAGPGRVLAWDNAGKALSDWQPVALRDAEDKTVDLALNRSGEVKGTVVDDQGNAVSGVYVRMDLIDGDDMCEAMTDARGQFDCAMLTGGSYRPTVVPSPGGRIGFAAASSDGLQPIRVPPDGVVTGVTLAVMPARVTIRGKVIDDVGAAVPDVHVAAIGPGYASMAFPSAMTDVQGRFAIEDLARGTYIVHARAADGSDTQVAGISAGGDELVVTLARAGAIEGTLIGFSTTPNVLLTKIGGELSIAGRAAVGDATFSRIGLSPGRYLVYANAGGDVDAKSIDVKPGATSRVALSARAAGRIEGTVVDSASRTPIAGMRCDANVIVDGLAPPVPPDPSHQAFSDDAGQFSVAAPLGRVRIHCFSSLVPRPSAIGEVEVTSMTVPAKLTVLAPPERPSGR